MGLLAVLLVACGSDDEDKKAETGGEVDEADAGGSLNIASSGQPQTLDPHISLAQATVDVMGNVYESLLTTDSNREVRPMLAESYEPSEDGKEVVFKLREGVLFHNGDEMKAEDVAASMNRWKDTFGGRDQLDDAEFVVEDDYTVVLKLPEPLATTMSILSYQGPSFAAVMPKEIIDKAEATGVDEYIGTGPFKYEDWVQDQHVKLVKFDDYQSRDEEADGLFGKKEALLDEITFTFTPDTSTRVAGIQTGEFDIASRIPIDNVEILENDPNLYSQAQPYGYVSVNLNKKNGPFQEEKLRQAVSVGIDRNQILTGAFSDEEYYVANHSMMMDSQSEWASDYGKDFYQEADIEAAKELIAESDYNDEEIRVVVTRDYIDHYNAAVVLQSQLEEIGLNAKLEVYDWPTVLDREDDPEGYEIIVLIDLPAPEPSSHFFLNPESSGWTDSEEMLEIVKEFRAQPTLEDAEPYYEELLEWFYDYTPMVKIGDVNNVDYLRNEVEGFKFQDRYVLWNVTNSK